MALRTVLTFLGCCVLMAACSSTTVGGGDSGSSTGSGGNGGAAASSSSGSGGGGPTECHSMTDCGNGEYCNVVNLPPLCGGQCDNTFNNDCQVDSDCADAGVGFICDIPCKCPHGGAQPSVHCAQGCMKDADCGPSLGCTPTHRCEPLFCTLQSQCTANFTCIFNPVGCAPKACTKDADCGDFCVNGSCSATLGACALAVP